MTWTVAVQEITPPAHPEALTDLQPLLERLIVAFGVRPLSILLDVDHASISNWRSAHRRMSAEMSKRVIDLHDVLTRALQIFAPDTAMRWLVGNEPFLNHARPIDVLALRGAAPLIDALEGIDAGAYA
jgi:putative toxin-antitoxin system antitoxin component (TIGR02293 family)